MEIAIIILLAVAVDIAFGELPNPLHPVAWLGKVISWETKWAPKRGKIIELIYGIGMVLVTLGVIVTCVYFLLIYLKQFSPVAYIFGAAFLLKLSFSLSGLKKAAVKVRDFMAGDNQDGARRQLRALVSRDATSLDEEHLVSAVVESVAENSCDSFVAPIGYFLIFGVPGAVAYRVINTFDAMVGYHGHWEYLGKFAARLDDVVNFLPARLTALIIILATYLRRRDVAGAWHIMLRDHGRTKSPNAGWTMSAMAGALGVQLEKAGYYKLGDNHYSLALETIDSSLQLVVMVALLWSAVSVLTGVMLFVIA